MNIRAILSSLATVAALVLFSTCSDWTDVSNLDTDEIIAREKDEQLYQQYLSNLRQWRQSDHKVVIGWFDNSVKIPSSRAHHITDVPDSVDVIALIYPDNLAEFELEDIRTVRRDKDMKVIYSVSYDDIRNDIELEIMAAERAGETPPDLESTFRERFNEQLSYFSEYGYDGISINYSGKHYDFMDAEEFMDLVKYQDLVFGTIKEMMTDNPGALFLFEGMPQNVVDRSLLNDYDYIVLKTQNAATINEVALIADDAVIDMVPTDRIIISTYAKSTAADDTQTGIFWIRDPESGQASEYSSMVVISDWILEPSFYQKAGIGIYRISDDYYNSDLVYKNVRNVINTMNPSPLN